MNRLAPVSRDELVRRLRRLGFEGPYSGGRHLFMTRGQVRLVVPIPHRSVIVADLLSRILREAGVSRADWLRD